MTMKGFEPTETNNGCPIPDYSRPAEFNLEDVKAFGKQMVWGDSTPYLLVRLNDGRQLYFRGKDQDADGVKWLRKTTKKIYHKSMKAGCQEGWRFKWIEL
jgi:hypothetical protein